MKVIEIEPPKTHETFVIGFNDKNEIVFLKSYDYSRQKAEAQADLKWVIENCKGWRISAAFNWILEDREGQSYKISVEHG